MSGRLATNGRRVSTPAGPGWVLENKGTRGGKGAVWRHESGWAVRHCGHPTALYPYYLTHPDIPRAGVFSFNGKGWCTVSTARAVVEQLVAGKVEHTDTNCTPGTRVVPTLTASGGTAPVYP